MRFFMWNPGRVLFGRGVLEKLGDEVSRLGSRALLVTGRTFARKHGYTDRLVNIMREAGVEVAVFDKVEPNPSAETVDLGAQEARRHRAEVVVAFGGGSPMDAAKGIAVVASLGGTAYDYFYPYVVEKEVLPVVALPTTAGTGSEVTRYAVITDTRTNKKTVIVGYPIIPRAALLDPEVLKHMPPQLTAWTGFDALSHAVEAFLSKKSTPLVDIYAKEAVRIIFNHLPEAVRGSENDREKVFFASLLAGLAINDAGTILVHGLGYYLTTHHNVHHGLANALILPAALEALVEAVPEKLGVLAKAAGLATADPLAFIDALKRLEDSTGLPRSLREVGVSPGELDRMVELATQYRRNLENSPLEVTEDVIRAIYETALQGR